MWQSENDAVSGATPAQTLAVPQNDNEVAMFVPITGGGREKEEFGVEPCRHGDESHECWRKTTQGGVKPPCAV
jgi:hypothetical protein